MPLYEYNCECGYVDSFFHKMDEKPSYECPECGKTMNKSLGLNFKLKGDGYYSKSNLQVSDAKRVKQTVMGVDPDHLDKVDNKIKNKAMKAKPIDPV